MIVMFYFYLCNTMFSFALRLTAQSLLVDDSWLMMFCFGLLRCSGSVWRQPVWNPGFTICQGDSKIKSLNRDIFVKRTPGLTIWRQNN